MHSLPAGRSLLPNISSSSPGLWLLSLVQIIHGSIWISKKTRLLCPFSPGQVICSLLCMCIDQSMSQLVGMLQAPPVALLWLPAPPAPPAVLGKQKLLPSQGFTERENREAKTMGSQPSNKIPVVKKEKVCYLLCTSLQLFLQLCLQPHGPDGART